MKRIKMLVASMAMVLGIGVFASAPVGAINVFPTCNVNGSPVTDKAICKAAGTDEVDSLLKIVVNTMLYIAGAVAVIMLIFGGIRYTTSNGDSNMIKTAKDTVMYSVVGLIISFVAYALVNWVLNIF